MNIFCTNDDPDIAAIELCDQHVRSKMQIEGAIMLAHAFDQEVLNHKDCPRTKLGKPRKSGRGYFNHQCSKWTRESKDNFKWLVDHTLRMFKERDFRWPDSKPHHTLSFIEWCGNNIHNTNITKQSRTPFAVAISDNCECRKNPEFDKLSTLEKYKEYIRKDKPFATWTGTKKPSWY
tara:strand:+ start:572 stop:1102 length:531 start_codon:yes stop_codon:yes gene_type:complete